MSQRNISIPQVSRAATPSPQVIAPEVCGMMRFPPWPYAATSVMADSSCIAFMASSESRT